MTAKEVSTLKIGDKFICDDYFEITNIYEDNGKTYVETRLCWSDDDDDGEIFDTEFDTGVGVKWPKKILLSGDIEKC